MALTSCRLRVVSSLFFKTVDSKDAVAKATRMYLRRVLGDRVEATYDMYIHVIK